MTSHDSRKTALTCGREPRVLAAARGVRNCSVFSEMNCLGPSARGSSRQRFDGEIVDSFLSRSAFPKHQRFYEGRSLVTPSRGSKRRCCFVPEVALECGPGIGIREGNWLYASLGVT